MVNNDNRIDLSNNPIDNVTLHTSSSQAIWNTNRNIASSERGEQDTISNESDPYVLPSTSSQEEDAVDFKQFAVPSSPVTRSKRRLDSYSSASDSESVSSVFNPVLPSSSTTLGSRLASSLLGDKPKTARKLLKLSSYSDMGEMTYGARMKKVQSSSRFKGGPVVVPSAAEELRCSTSTLQTTPHKSMCGSGLKRMEGTSNMVTMKDLDLVRESPAKTHMTRRKSRDLDPMMSCGDNNNVSNGLKHSSSSRFLQPFELPIWKKKLSSYAPSPQRADPYAFPDMSPATAPLSKNKSKSKLASSNSSIKLPRQMPADTTSSTALSSILGSMTDSSSSSIRPTTVMSTSRVLMPKKIDSGLGTLDLVPQFGFGGKNKDISRKYFAPSSSAVDLKISAGSDKKFSKSDGRRSTSNIHPTHPEAITAQYDNNVLPPTLTRERSSFSTTLSMLNLRLTPERRERERRSMDRELAAPPRLPPSPRRKPKDEEKELQCPPTSIRMSPRKKISDGSTLRSSVTISDLRMSAVKSPRRRIGSPCPSPMKNHAHPEMEGRSSSSCQSQRKRSIFFGSMLSTPTKNQKVDEIDDLKTSVQYSLSPPILTPQKTVEETVNTTMLSMNSPSLIAPESVKVLFPSIKDMMNEDEDIADKTLNPDDFHTPEQSFHLRVSEDLAPSIVLPVTKDVDRKEFVTPSPSVQMDVDSTTAVPTAEVQMTTLSLSPVNLKENVKDAAELSDKMEEKKEELERTKTQLKSALSSKNTMKRAVKRNIHFNHVDVFYFDRVLGGATVSKEGEVTLAMANEHFTTKSFSLNNRRRPILTLADEEEEELSEGEVDPMEQYSAEFSSTRTIEPIQSKKIIKMLRKAGVIVKKPFDTPLESLRESRRDCGCSCVDGICLPETCRCHQEGIQCQMDAVDDDVTGRSHPCWCSATSCHNPQGRVEFDPERVKIHYITTAKRIKDMEKSGIIGSPQVIKFDDDGKHTQYSYCQTPPPVAYQDVATTSTVADVDNSTGFDDDDNSFIGIERDEGTPLCRYPVTPVYQRTPHSRIHINSTGAEFYSPVSLRIRDAQASGEEERLAEVSSTPQRYFPTVPSLM